MRGIPEPPRERPCLDGQRHAGEPVDNELIAEGKVSPRWVCRHCLALVWPGPTPPATWSTLSPSARSAERVVYS